MKITLRVSLLLLACLFISCEREDEDKREVYRSKKNGKARQTIVTTLSNPENPKRNKQVQEEEFDPATKKWNKLGPERLLTDAESAAETANDKPYDGDNDLPPSSASSAKPNNIYLANNYGDNDVIVLNANTLDVIKRIPMPAYMPAIIHAPDGLTVAVAVRILGGYQIRFIDVITNTVTRTLVLPANADVKNIHYSLDGATIYISDNVAGIFVYQNSNLSLVKTIPLPTGIIQVRSSTLSPDGEILLVSTSGNVSTLILEVSTLSWTAGVTAGNSIFYSDRPCVFHPTGKEIYCLATGGVAIIDGATMSVVATVAFSQTESVYRMHATDGGAFLMVTSDKAVRMIDPAARAIVSTLNPPAGQFFSNAYPILKFP